MPNTIEELFYHFSESVELDEQTRGKLKALATAELALLDELEQCCEPKYRNLLDVLSALESESTELRAKALFAAALETGMALGRLQVS